MTAPAKLHTTEGLSLVTTEVLLELRSRGQGQDSGQAQDKGVQSEAPRRFSSDTSTPLSVPGAQARLGLLPDRNQKATLTSGCASPCGVGQLGAVRQARPCQCSCQTSEETEASIPPPPSPLPRTLPQTTSQWRGQGPQPPPHAQSAMTLQGAWEGSDPGPA